MNSGMPNNTKSSQLDIDFCGCTFDAVKEHLDELLAQPSDDGTLVWKVAAAGNVEVLDALLQREECKSLVDQKRPADGVSPLYIACQNGHLDIAELLLLKAGADINSQRDTLATPLFISTQKNHLDMTRLLLRHRASIDVANNQGCTPFVLACSMGHTAIAMELLGSGASPEHVGTGKTGLAWARSEKREDTLRALQVFFVSLLNRKFLFNSWMQYAKDTLQRRKVREDDARRAQAAKQAFLSGGQLPSFSTLTSMDTELHPFDLLDIKKVGYRTTVGGSTMVSTDSEDFLPLEMMDLNSMKKQGASPRDASLRQSANEKPTTYRGKIIATLRDEFDQEVHEPLVESHMTPPPRTTRKDFSATTPTPRGADHPVPVHSSPTPQKYYASPVVHAAKVTSFLPPEDRFAVSGSYLTLSGYNRWKSATPKTPKREGPTLPTGNHSQFSTPTRKGPKFKSVSLYN